MTTLTASPLPIAPPDAMTVTKMAIRDFSAFGASLIPFALTIGTASASNGLSLAQTLFGAVFLLAGTAQLAATELFGSGATVPVVVTTILVINVRFVLYGAGLGRWFADASRFQRMLLAVPLVDQSFLCCDERFETLNGLAARRRYYLTGTALLAALFFTGQIVGYVAGGAFAAHRTSKMSAALAVGLPIYWIGALAGFV